MICVFTRDGKELFKDIYTVSLPLDISLNIPDGHFYLQIYYESHKGSNYYYGINSTEGFPLIVANGCISSIVPATLSANKEFYLSQKNDFQIKLR